MYAFFFAATISRNTSPVNLMPVKTTLNEKLCPVLYRATYRGSASHLGLFRYALWRQMRTCCEESSPHPEEAAAIGAPHHTPASAERGCKMEWEPHRVRQQCLCSRCARGTGELPVLHSRGLDGKKQAMKKTSPE